MEDQQAANQLGADKVLGADRLWNRRGSSRLAQTLWTPEEDKRKLVEAGRPIEIVAAELRRSVTAVKTRAYVDSEYRSNV